MNTIKKVRSVSARLLSGGPSGIVARFGWASVTEVLQLVSSVAVFVIVANLISQADYGQMSAVLGVAFPTLTLTAFGTHILLMKRVAQGQDLANAWARATAIGILGPLVGVAFGVLIVQPYFLSTIDATTFALLFVSQVSFFWITELATFLGVGAKRLKDSAQVRLLVVVTRLAGLAVFAVFGRGSLKFWAWSSMISFGVAAFGAVLMVWNRYGARPSITAVSLQDLREGLPFSVNSGSESLVDSMDRPLLLNYAGEEDAGVYGLGGRIIQFGYLPIRILLRASDADVFAAGKDGVASAWRVTRRQLVKPGIGVGAFVTVGFLVFAPLVPILVGEKYNEAVPAIRMLAVLPLIRSVQYLFGNCLSASTHQQWRTMATIAAVVVNLALNLRLLPNGSWRTAVGTTLVSELFLALVLGFMILYLSQKETALP